MQLRFTVIPFNGQTVTLGSEPPSPTWAESYESAVASAWDIGNLAVPELMRCLPCFKEKNLSYSPIERSLLLQLQKLTRVANLLGRFNVLFGEAFQRVAQRVVLRGEFRYSARESKVNCTSLLDF